jgi:uncharacterized protein
VPALRSRISLYTNRTVEPQHADVVKGNVYVDFGGFPPQDIVAGLISQEKQDSVFANLLRSQDWDRWKELVGVLAKDGFATEDRKMAELLSYRPQGRQQQYDVSLSAIKNNLVPPIKRLHRSGATLGKNIIEELKQNRVVIADVSLLGSEDGLAITGMLRRRIFYNNVRHLTDRKTGQTVRCLAVLEEAQTMLGDRGLDDRNVFVRWVKEGRKYGLGCVLVTQQPSSISDQIISQGDNFFVLHLLNENDLQTLKRHNAYFSDEILGFIRGSQSRATAISGAPPVSRLCCPRGCTILKTSASNRPKQSNRLERRPPIRRLSATGLPRRSRRHSCPTPVFGSIR